MFEFDSSFEISSRIPCSNQLDSRSQLCSEDRSGTRKWSRSVRTQFLIKGGRIVLNLSEDRSENPGIGLGHFTDRDSLSRIGLSWKSGPTRPKAHSEWHYKTLSPCPSIPRLVNICHGRK